MAGGSKSLCEKRGGKSQTSAEYRGGKKKKKRKKKKSSHGQSTGNACFERTTESLELDWICPTMRDYFIWSGTRSSSTTRNYSIQARFSIHTPHTHWLIHDSE